MTKSKKELDERSVLADRYVPAELRRINTIPITTQLVATKLPSLQPELLLPSLVPATPTCYCTLKHPTTVAPIVRSVIPELRFALFEQNNGNGNGNGRNPRDRRKTQAKQKKKQQQQEQQLPTVDGIGHLESYCSTFEKLLWQERERILSIYEEYSQYNVPIRIAVATVENNKKNLTARIAIPGIADARPSLQSGDHVLFRPMRPLSMPISRLLQQQPIPPHAQQQWSSAWHCVEIDAQVLLTQRSSSNNTSTNNTKQPQPPQQQQQQQRNVDVVRTTWLDPVSHRTMEQTYSEQRYNVRFVPSVKLYQRCLSALAWLKVTMPPKLAMDLLFPTKAPNLDNNEHGMQLLRLQERSHFQKSSSAVSSTSSSSSSSLLTTEQRYQHGQRHATSYHDDLNKEQAMFVDMVCLRTALPSTTEIRPPLLLTGPAGTGKTMTLLKAIVQVLLQQQEQQQHDNSDTFTQQQKQQQQCILVCTPSHTAADVVTTRLAAMMTEHGNIFNNNNNNNSPAAKSIFRLYDSDRPVETVPVHMLQYSCQTGITGSFALPSVKNLFSYQVIVCTCSDAHLLYRAGFTNEHLRLRRRCFQTYFERTMSECNLTLSGGADSIQGVDEPHFTHLFIDEAAQATEPETLIPLSVVVDPLPGNRKVEIVLVGDPRQLSPNVYCAKAANCGLGKSLLERLLQRPVQCLGGGHPHMLGPPTLGALHTMQDWIQYAFQKEGQDYLSVFLTLNYRGHASFLMMPSTLFYFDKLQSAKTNGKGGGTSSSLWIRKLREIEQLSSQVEVKQSPNVVVPPMLQPQRQASSSWPMHFRAVVGRDTSVALDSFAGSATDSWSNEEEARAVVDIVMTLTSTSDGGVSVSTQSIGVMAPFRAQVVRIRRLLREKNLGGVNVGTIEDYQAVERDVIVLSLTRSNSQFVANDVERRMGVFQQPKRTNVATTRAENLFIVVGNPVVMSKDPIWRQWLWFFHRNALWYGEKGGKKVLDWFSPSRPPFRCVRHRPGIDSAQFSLSINTPTKEGQDEDDIVTVSTLECSYAPRPLSG